MKQQRLTLQVPQVTHASLDLRADKCLFCGVNFATVFASAGGMAVYAYPILCPFCGASLSGEGITGRMVTQDGAFDVFTKECPHCAFLFPFFIAGDGARRYTVPPNYCPSCGVAWRENDPPVLRQGDTHDE